MRRVRCPSTLLDTQSAAKLDKMAEEAAKTAEAEGKSKKAKGATESKGDGKSAGAAGEDDDIDPDDLLGDGDADVAGMLEGAADEASVTHKLAFNKKTTLLVREEAMGEQVFGSSARYREPIPSLRNARSMSVLRSCSEDTSGASIWAASIVLARWIVDLKDKFAKKTVCELGSGCGLAGLTGD